MLKKDRKIWLCSVVCLEWRGKTRMPMWICVPLNKKKKGNTQPNVNSFYLDVTVSIGLSLHLVLPQTLEKTSNHILLELGYKEESTFC